MPNIQETLSRAIGLLGDDVLKRSKLLINVIEDINPCLNDDIRFLRKVYSDEVGMLLYRSRQDGYEKEKYLNELSDYLINECGYNDDWKNRFVSMFMFLFEVNKLHDSTNRITSNTGIAEETPAKKYDRAVAYYEAGQTDEAISVLEQIRDGAIYEAKAQLLLGDIFETDSRKSFDYYLKAANLGETKAQFLVGYMFEYGEGTEKNVSLASVWYKKAADAGNRGAQHNLAYFYYAGIAVQQDYKKAFEYFQLAAKQGKADSMRNIGVMYEYGQYVTKNYDKALHWYQQAIANGNGDALHDYNNLLAIIKKNNQPKYCVELRVQSRGEGKKDLDVIVGELIYGVSVSKHLKPGPLFKIIYNKNSKTIGIKNMSNTSWIIVTDNNTKINCMPDDVVSIKAGYTIKIGKRIVQLDVLSIV